jgi:hypothetical protein
MRININDNLFQRLKKQSKKHDGVKTIQLIEYVLTAYMDGLKDHENKEENKEVNTQC